MFEKFTSVGMLCRDVNRAHEEWFSNMDDVKASIGLADDSQPGPSSSIRLTDVQV